MKSWSSDFKQNCILPEMDIAQMLTQLNRIKIEDISMLHSSQIKAKLLLFFINYLRVERWLDFV